MRLERHLEEGQQLHRGEINIDTNEIRNYFQSFVCESLSYNADNKNLLDGFCSKKMNNTLEGYLKNEKEAWNEDLEGETKVFLIKDYDGEIALYFSLKCGLLIDGVKNEKLSKEDSEFVSIVVDTILEGNQESLNQLFEAGEALYKERVDYLFQCAQEKVDFRKNASNNMNEIQVDKCYSAIELRHFCKNENYQVKEGIDIPLGVGLFWEIIVPHILTISEQIGCKYLYLFAADLGVNYKSLVNYYKTQLYFYECDEDDVVIVKPQYDMNCYGLIQRINQLSNNRSMLWNSVQESECS